MGQCVPGGSQYRVISMARATHSANDESWEVNLHDCPTDLKGDTSDDRPCHPPDTGRQRLAGRLRHGRSSARTSAAAVALFDDDCYWRDLVAFTWNIKTHGRAEAIRAMLAGPRWPTTQPAHCASRGRGHRGRRRDRGLVHLRDRGGARARPSAPEGRQGLDAADHDDRAEGLRGSKGATRRQGRRARRASRTARPGSSADAGRGATLGYATQPYCVIIGGGQGGIALGARLQRLGVPTIIVEKNARAGDSLAQPLQVALPARPGLVRPPALPAVPRPLAGLLAQGQDRRLAGDVHQGDGAELLDARPSARRRRYDEATQEWAVQRRARRRDR